MDPSDYTWALSYLRSGEQILWRGRPAKLHIIEKLEQPFLLFGFFWLAVFAYFVVLPSLQGEKSRTTWILIVLFLLVGLYVTVGRLIQKAVCLRASFYVITSDRILVLVHRQVHFYKKTELPSLTVLRYSDGEGSIILVPIQKTLPHSITHPLYADMRNVIHSIADVDAALWAIREGAA